MRIGMGTRGLNHLPELSNQRFGDQPPERSSGGNSAHASIPFPQSCHGRHHETSGRFWDVCPGHVLCGKKQELRHLHIVQADLQHLVGATPWPWGGPYWCTGQTLAEQRAIKNKRLVCHIIQDFGRNFSCHPSWVRESLLSTPVWLEILVLAPRDSVRPSLVVAALSRHLATSLPFWALTSCLWLL